MVKNVLQNLTSLLSKTTSRIEAKAHDRITRRRRNVLLDAVEGEMAWKMTASIAKARLRMKLWMPSGRTV